MKNAEQKLNLWTGEVNKQMIINCLPELNIWATYSLVYYRENQILYMKYDSVIDVNMNKYTHSDVETKSWK